MNGLIIERIDLNRHPIVSHCIAHIPFFIKNET
jgi:hypothetical protein